MSALDYTVEFSDPALRDLVLASLSAPIPEVVAPVENISDMVRSIVSNMADDNSTLGAFESLVSMTEEIKEERAIKKPKASKPVVEVPVEAPIVQNVFLNDVKDILNKKPVASEINLSRQVVVRTVTAASENVHVVIAGVGGTGSRIAPMIAQLMLSRTNISLSFVDPDVVESKNLLRQNFYDFEVGAKKAEALKDRFEAIYGINIQSVPFTFNNFTIDSRTSSLIIFDCTDNLEARKQIETFTNSSGFSRTLKEIVLISCGNQKDFGQVQFSYKYCGTDAATRNFNTYLNSSYPSTNALLLNNKFQSIMEDVKHLSTEHEFNEISYLPSFLEFNKDFKDSTESISCANFDIAEEQSMAINSTIAQIAFNMFFEFMSANGIRHNIIWANLSNSYSGNQINTAEKYLEFVAKSVFGKNIVFELDKYTALLQGYSSVYFEVNSALRNIKYGELSEAISTHYVNPLIDNSSSTWYFSPGQIEAIVSRFYTDCEAAIDEAIFNNLTKENFGESYLRYCIIMKHIAYNLYEIFACSKSKIQRTGQERITVQLLERLNAKYVNIILEKQSEYNMLILKPGV